MFSASSYVVWCLGSAVAARLHITDKKQSVVVKSLPKSSDRGGFDGFPPNWSEQIESGTSTDPALARLLHQRLRMFLALLGEIAATPYPAALRLRL